MICVDWFRRLCAEACSSEKSGEALIDQSRSQERTLLHLGLALDMPLMHFDHHTWDDGRDERY